MNDIIQFIRTSISDTLPIIENRTNILFASFKIQIYHNVFEVYFCNCYFGALTKEDVFALLRLFKKGNEN